MRQINLFTMTSDEQQELKTAMATDPELRAWARSWIAEVFKQLPTDEQKQLLDVGEELPHVEELMERLLAHGSFASGTL